MEKELKLYKSLNRLANADGTVIFGDADDRVIPLAELKETFELQNNYYNRSFSGLSLSNSADLFDQCVAPLCPKDIYLHIGQNDLSLFEKEPSAKGITLSSASPKITVPSALASLFRDLYSFSSFSIVIPPLMHVHAFYPKLHFENIQQHSSKQ